MIQGNDTLIDGQLDDKHLAEMIVQQAYERERRQRCRSLPGWLGPTMRLLPRVLATVTFVNGLIGLIAVIAPLLSVVVGEEVTSPIYTAYAFICPQRPSHTWFVWREPMAMEQRMVAIYLASGLAGILYLLWSRLRRPLPTWAAVVGIAPVLIDVAISTVEIRPSTATSRLWTGTLAAIALVWWAYPRFDAELRRVQEHVRTLRGHNTR